jgi:hypothetical protein
MMGNRTETRYAQIAVDLVESVYLPAKMDIVMAMR